MMHKREAAKPSDGKHGNRKKTRILIAVLALMLMLPSAGCDPGEDGPGNGPANMNPTLSEPYGDAAALFAFSKRHLNVFTQHVSDEGTVGYELMSGNWQNDENKIIRFNTGEKQMIMGERSSGGGSAWWLQELLATGDPGRETDNGTWDYYYDALAGYQVYGHPFIFGQLEKEKSNGADYNSWFIQKINGDGTMGPQTESGHWEHFYHRIIGLSFDGPTFLLGHTRTRLIHWDVGKRRWFIQRVHDTGKMGGETDSGTWHHYYGNLVFFKTVKSHFIFGQTDENKHWFIQRVHSDGRLGGETDSGYWDHYYDTAATFMRDGKVYLFCQTKKADRDGKYYWFINHITEDGIMAAEEDHGYWEHYYDFVYPFEFDWSYRHVSHWMGDYDDILHDRKLKDICLPGSHDSGMSSHHSCSGGIECNTVTQPHTIAGQLDDGARYFDFRPVYDHHSATWNLGHFAKKGDYLYGCCGQSLDDALKDVEEFFKDDANSKELVILNFSHCYINKLGLPDGICNDDDRLEVLAKVWDKLDDLLVKCDDCEPYDMTLDEIRQAGGMNVIVRFEDFFCDYMDEGVFCDGDLEIYNVYSNKDDYTKMRDNQVDKLLNKKNHEDKLFLLSWTLTLNTTDAMNCDSGITPSILELARIAGPKLLPELTRLMDKKEMTKELFPNILYVDNYHSFATRAAILVNQRFDDLDP